MTNPFFFGNFPLKVVSEDLFEFLTPKTKDKQTVRKMFEKSELITPNISQQKKPFLEDGRRGF